MLSDSTWEIRCQCKCEIAPQCSQRFHENLNINLKYFQQRGSSPTHTHFFPFLLPCQLEMKPCENDLNEAKEDERGVGACRKFGAALLRTTSWAVKKKKIMQEFPLTERKVWICVKMSDYNIQDMYTFYWNTRVGLKENKLIRKSRISFNLNLKKWKLSAR